MNAATYFRHIRTLGAFRAADAMVLAREAAALDCAAAAKHAADAGPYEVAYEVMPDGSTPVRFSRNVKVY